MALISTADASALMTSLKFSGRENFCLCPFKVTTRRNPVGPDLIAQPLILTRVCLLDAIVRCREKEEVAWIPLCKPDLVFINKDPEKKQRNNRGIKKRRWRLEGAESQAGDDESGAG